MVRAKFKVTHITQHIYPGTTVKLMAIYDTGIPEDQRFAEATPTGSLEMLITNPAALAEFEIDRSFYLDFTPVEK